MSLRRLAMVAFLGAAVGAAAACSSPAPPHSGPGGGPAPATSQPAGGGNANAAASASECAKAPSGQVGKALGIAVGKVTVTVEGPVTVCAYAGRYPVVVRYQTGENASEFAQARQNQVSLHEAVGTVSGLGDDAYFASYTATKPVSNTLGALKGSIAVFITSPASSGAESTLMVELLEKV
jgi:hypothetical protein